MVTEYSVRSTRDVNDDHTNPLGVMVVAVTARRVERVDHCLTGVSCWDDRRMG